LIYTCRLLSADSPFAVRLCNIDDVCYSWREACGNGRTLTPTVSIVAAELVDPSAATR
jgi:hypothetical protein